MSSSQRQTGPKGYFAALLGGLGGAATALVAFVVVARLFMQTQPQPASLPGPSFGIGIAILVGITLAEVLGCWLGLRWGGYVRARTTATWLTILFIPGWMLFLLLSLVLNEVLSVLLLVSGLPLLARVLTNNPNFPNTVAQMMHIYAKRPPGR